MAEEEEEIWRRERWRKEKEFRKCFLLQKALGSRNACVMTAGVFLRTFFRGYVRLCVLCV